MKEQLPGHNHRNEHDLQWTLETYYDKYRESDRYLDRHRYDGSRCGCGIELGHEQEGTK
jgi:hypothetical protein